MNPPYEECKSCIATPWCQRYSGKVKVPDTPSWCNPKFRLDKALAMTGIPKKYRTANAYSYQKDKENEFVYQELRPFLVDIVKTIDEGTNFFFYGNRPGTGKTFHGSMILNHFVQKTCLTNRFDFENPLGMFVVYSDLMDELRYHKDDDNTVQLLDKIKNTPVLLIDDFGSGTVSPYSVDQTYILINYRYNNGLSTIITSNLGVSELVKSLGTRIVSRVLGDCLELELGGRDRRRDKKC